MNARPLGIASGLLCAMAVSAAAAGLRGHLEVRASAARLFPDAALERKCSASLLDLLGNVQPRDPVTVWIYLGDRGPLQGGAVLDPRAGMSPRAASRRRLRAESLEDWHDLPVWTGYIDSLRTHLVRFRHASRYFNAVSAEIEAREIPAVCSHPFVTRVDRVAAYRRSEPPGELPGAQSGVSPVPAGRLSEPYGESFYQLDQAGIIGLLEEGYNGSGRVSGGEPVLIGVLDTGFKLAHTAFSGVKVEAQWDFVQGDSVTSNQAGDGRFQDRHGTWVLSVIAGQGFHNLIGPAWGAKYLLAKTEIDSIEIPVEEDHWVAGIEWADSAGADVVTSSLGYISWYTQAQLDGRTALCTIAAGIAVSHGIVVVNSAGNEDGAGLIAPADGDSVLAIGAVDRYGVIAPFSSRGPTADGRTKPDFVAMGVSVQMASYSDVNGYEKQSGTSFSAPIVAGLCALLLEIHPDWSPMRVREALRATSSRSGFPDNTYGYGIPDAALASKYPEAVAMPGPFPNPFSTETKLQFAMSAPGRMSARVYDCRGALIKTLADGRLSQRVLTLSWDGTNELGSNVASGVYFVVVRSKALNRTIKVVRIR